MNGNVLSTSLTQKQIKRNQIAYIFEAGFEYFISIMIADAFLTTLLIKADFTDAQIGIITQVASFSLIAQLLSVFVRKNTGMKMWLTGMHLVNQILFFLLYLTPFLNIPTVPKQVLLVGMYFGGYIIANIISPYKLPWMMSFVPDGRRGVYTAIKEMTNLVAGMALNFTMSFVVDHFNALADADPEGMIFGFFYDDFALVLCGATVLISMVLHTISILVMKDRSKEEIAERNRNMPRLGIVATVKRTFSNPTLVRLIFIDIMWQAASGIAVAFYGVYKINDLKFTYSFIAIIGIISAVGRLSFAMVFASIADKRSWTSMLTICFAIVSLSFGINIFTTPDNGAVMFTLHSIVFAIAMSGLNSGLWNIIFDFVPAEDRPAGLGIKNTFGGITALLASLVGSAILDAVQKNGNTIFGVTVYAQQILSGIACLITMGLCFYMKFVIAKLKKY